MNSLLEYYRLNTTDENGNSCYKFTRVKEEDIKICGKPLKEVITILNGLEAERITGIRLCIENINQYMDIILKEQQQQLIKVLNEKIGSDSQ